MLPETFIGTVRCGQVNFINIDFYIIYYIDIQVIVIKKSINFIKTLISFKHFSGQVNLTLQNL